MKADEYKISIVMLKGEKKGKYKNGCKRHERVKWSNILVNGVPGEKRDRRRKISERVTAMAGENQPTATAYSFPDADTHSVLSTAVLYCNSSTE